MVVRKKGAHSNWSMASLTRVPAPQPTCCRVFLLTINPSLSHQQLQRNHIESQESQQDRRSMLGYEGCLNQELSMFIGELAGRAEHATALSGFTINKAVLSGFCGTGGGIAF